MVLFRKFVWNILSIQKNNTWIPARGQSTQKDPHNFGIKSIRIFANYLLSEVDKNSLNNKRVAIMRTNKRRTLSNNDQIMDILRSEYNFHFFSPGKMSLERQISLFNNAEYIVGQSGAEWSNIIFCNRQYNVKALCFCYEKYKDHWNHLASVASIDMNYLYTKKESDAYVDVKKMRLILDSFFK